MLDGSESESNCTINLMIENLLIDKSKEELNLQLEYENDYCNIIQNNSERNNLSNNQHLIELLNNNVYELMDRKNQSLI